MNIDVACVGSPFLDLIFRGLPSLPVPGEEQVAERLVIVPGGMANVAYALRCLGLEAVVCAPIGRDPAGRLLGELMADAGVPWLGHDADATPVSVALPADGERAFVTVIPPVAVDLEALARITSRAIVVDLPSVELLPPHSQVYAVVGDPEVNTLVGRLPSSLGSVRALILNERELHRLTGLPEVAEAAGSLAALGATVVVTRGAGGAGAIEPGGQMMTVAAPTADVPDATGAGDLFAAAYVWADLAGRPLEERLDLATRYASLSLERATDRQKGIPLRDFIAAGSTLVR
jgi:sugar/nucleoside kinase (ribokinase family)